MMKKIDFTAAENAKFRGQLGAVYSPAATIFRIWQPFAEKAVLRLYNADRRRCETRDMVKKNSVFEVKIRGGLEGKLYDFCVEEGGAKRVFADPYARLVTPDGKLGIVADMRAHAPQGWEQHSFRAAENPIIYELSVRDFSTDENANFASRGKFPAFYESDVINSFGDEVGLSYIKKLGVTHIQLMPIFDFDFLGKEYNWGYNPRFFNSPSAYYSHNDAIYELRKLVVRAHENGLGVIADVVYNHVFDAKKSSFEKLFPGYFFRGDGEFSNGSGCGNEFASERTMARKFILDSLCFLVREYKFDGFRFDLMGLLDLKTMREAVRRLRRINPEILLLGEGWTGGVSPLPERLRAVQKNAGRLSDAAFFNDRFRDAIRGSVFDVRDVGFVSGSRDERKKEAVLRQICGDFSDDFPMKTAAQCVNYIECHDNHTLYDRLKISLNSAASENILLAEKFAAALLALSRGKLFLHAGQEFLRTKNGADNSYDLGDEVNALRWDLVSKNAALIEYYRGLIAFRKRFYDELEGLRERKIPRGILLENEKFVVLINDQNEKTAEIRGNFEVFIDENRASDAPICRKNVIFCENVGVVVGRKIK